jgi:uncharacterized protein
VWDTLWLVLAGFSAGLIDAMVGGGGLIQVPALFWLFPGAPAATILGNSKFGGIFGTAAAFLQYRRRVQLPIRTLLHMCAYAAVGALIGAWLLTKLSNQAFKVLLPILLTLIFCYTLWRKDFGNEHAPKLSPAQERKVAGIGGAGIGLYDGFFGPGTGSFLVFLFVRVFGFDFVHASAMAKGVNVACNAAALTLFISTGHLFWKPALILAAANMSGGLLGSTLALRYGSVWMRKIFIVVVGSLILRTLYAAFFGA